MTSGWKIGRVKRIVAAVLSIISTLLIMLVLIVLRDSNIRSDFHWGNGGEEVIVAYFAYLAGIPLLMSLIVVIPSVLLIPIDFQRRRWPAMLAFAALVPILVECCLARSNPLQIWLDWPLFFVDETFALGCCGQYLLLLRWLASRTTEAVHNGKSYRSIRGLWR